MRIRALGSVVLALLLLSVPYAAFSQASTNPPGGLTVVSPLNGYVVRGNYVVIGQAPPNTTVEVRTTVLRTLQAGSTATPVLAKYDSAQSDGDGYFVVPVKISVRPGDRVTYTVNLVDNAGTASQATQYTIAVGE